MQGVMQPGRLAAFQERGLSSGMGTAEPSVYQQPSTGISVSASLPMQYSQAPASAGQTVRAPEDTLH